jgi:glucokinase
MRILGAQIGEVQTELALFEGEDAAALTLSQRQRFDSASFSGVVPMIGEFMRGVSVDAAAFGVPGLLRGSGGRLPDLPWPLLERELAPVLGTPRCLLLDDVQAAAFALAEGPPPGCAWLSDARPAPAPSPEAPALLVSIGASFGQALFFAPDRSLASEVGLTSFTPRNAIERRILGQLAEQLEHVSLADVLSSAGLRRLYDFLLREGLAPATALAELERAADPEAELARLGCRDLDRACAAAVAFFADILGATLRDAALSYLPWGGIYLTGGLIHRLRPALIDGSLLDAFLERPDLGALLARTPLGLLDDPELTLRGAQRAALGLIQRGPSASASS